MTRGRLGAIAMVLFAGACAVGRREYIVGETNLCPPPAQPVTRHSMPASSRSLLVRAAGPERQSATIRITIQSPDSTLLAQGDSTALLRDAPPIVLVTVRAIGWDRWQGVLEVEAETASVVEIVLRKDCHAWVRMPG